jgi:hypothetical protein
MLVQVGLRMTGRGESMVRVGGRPSVDSVLAAVEVMDISLSVLGLRRARSSAVGVTGEELLAWLALYP